MATKKTQPAPTKKEFFRVLKKVAKKKKDSTD